MVNGFVVHQPEQISYFMPKFIILSKMLCLYMFRFIWSDLADKRNFLSRAKVNVDYLYSAICG